MSGSRGLISKNLIRRLERLERSAGRDSFDYGVDVDQCFAVVKQAAMNTITPEDASVLTEIFARGVWSEDFTDEKKAVWARWDEAFTKAHTELQCPIGCSSYDVFPC